MPCAAWVAEMPSSADLGRGVEAEAEQEADRIHVPAERDTTRKSGRNMRASRPPPASRASSSSSTSGSPRRAPMNAAQTPRRMNRLARPMISRNSAETTVPMTPPMSWKRVEPALQRRRRRGDRDARPARRCVEWPSEKKKPTARVPCLPASACGRRCRWRRCGRHRRRAAGRTCRRGTRCPSSAGRSAKAIQRPGPGREVGGQQHAVGHRHLGPGTRWPVVERVGRHGGVLCVRGAMLHAAKRPATAAVRLMRRSCVSNSSFPRRPTGRLRTRWLTGRRKD